MNDQHNNSYNRLNLKNSNAAKQTNAHNAPSHKSSGANNGAADSGWHFDTQTESKLRAAMGVARDRALIVMGVFFVLFFAVGIKLVDATLISSAAYRHAGGGADKNKRIGSFNGRADIIDRNGQLLATSLPTVSLYADARHIIEPARTADRLRTVFPELERTKLVNDLSSGKRFVWLKRHMTPQQYATANNLGLPGIAFQREYRRVYPQGPLLVHALGYLGVDQEGLSGVEKKLDERLRTDSTPLRLSLDVRVQHILHRELQSAVEEFSAIGAAGMVMDAQNGEIVAMVSLPDFNPHEPGTASEEGRFSRTTLGVYEMGSTFKIFNTAMALDSGRVRLNDVFDATKPLRVGRFTISDFHPEKRPLNVPEIMMHSSNIGSVKMFEEVGVEGQKEFFRRMGFLKSCELEVPERGEPMIPSPWRDVNGMTISFGHGMAVSPLHVVSGVSAMVNGGLKIEPTLLKRDSKEIIVGERIISPRTSDMMRYLMRLVVTQGTAKTADAEGYMVGGKTGTADKLSGKRYSKNARLSSFVGAFPINNPRYVVFVMVDEPKGTKKTHGYATGGWVAAPVIGRVVAQIAPVIGIVPQHETEEEKAARPKGKRDPIPDYEEPLNLQPEIQGSDQHAAAYAFPPAVQLCAG